MISMTLRWRWVIAGLGSCLLSAHADTDVYRVTDAQGRVLYTDRPEPGGQRVDIPPLIVLPAATASQGVLEEDTGQAAPTGYDGFRIVAPGDGTILPIGKAGTVSVELAVEPELHPTHRVQLRLDGELALAPAHTRSLVLSDLVRGKHVLQAELLTAGGRVIQRSAPVTLYVQRASLHMPNNPNNPDR